MPDAQTFPPIRDYALIGDCRTAALVARDGSIEWLCLPNFDSSSIFGSILDRTKGGSLKTSPRHVESRSRRYIDDTNILETFLTCPTGRIRIVDFLPVDEYGAATLQPERELLRIVEAVDGDPDVEVDFAPAPHYGKGTARLKNRGRIGWTIDEPGAVYLLRSDIDLTPSAAGRLTGSARLRAGDRRYLSLSYVRRDPAVIPMLGREADAKLARSEAWWREWSAQCTYDGPYPEAVRRSALALKALQFCLSGAVLAAATTSLPEAIGAERNWDYRYCWLRDAAFMLRAFIDTGFYSEAGSFFDWLMHSTRLTQPKLQALYDIYGRTRLREQTLAHLSGYRNSRPVRVGNAAHDQLQLDIYGSVIAAATIYLERGNSLDRSERGLLRRLGETVCRSWRSPDNGIWEFRDGLRHNNWSKIMCWSSLNNLIRLNDAGILSVPRERFARERDAIAAMIDAQAYDEDYGSFVGAFGKRYLDATLLLWPDTGFIDAQDPRMCATWDRIAQELDHDALIDRYSAGTDRFSGREGAFVICSFWAVQYLAHAGRLDEAKARMETLLGYANDVGLLSEEIDPRDGSLLGNFPQAFSHTGLINAALAIAAAEKSRAAA